MKRIIITIFLTVITVLMLVGAHYKNISSIINVEVCRVKETRIISSVTSNGKVEEINKREIFISAPVVINQVKVRVGDEVKKGQQLLILDMSDLELELEKAKADEELEKINLERLMKMGNNDDALNIQGKKCAIAKMKVAEIERKLNFQNEIFKSPIDGIVTSVKAKEGILTNTIEPLITISDLDNLIVKVNLKEYYVSKVEKGQRVEITGDAFEGVTYRGKVSDISPVAIQLHSDQIEDTSIIVSVDILSKQTMLNPAIR